MTLSLVAEVTSHCCVVEGYIAGAAKVSSFSNTDNSKLQLKIALVASIFLLKNLIKIQSLNFFLKMYQCKCALHMYLFPIINNRCKMAYVQFWLLRYRIPTSNYFIGLFTESIDNDFFLIQINCSIFHIKNVLKVDYQFGKSEVVNYNRPSTW